MANSRYTFRCVNVTGGIGLTLRLYVGSKVQVVCHSVTLLHVLHRHLLRYAGMERTLGLLLVELLSL